MLFPPTWYYAGPVLSRLCGKQQEIAPIVGRIGGGAHHKIVPTIQNLPVETDQVDFGTIT